MRRKQVLSCREAGLKDLEHKIIASVTPVNDSTLVQSTVSTANISNRLCEGRFALYNQISAIGVNWHGEITFQK